MDAGNVIGLISLTITNIVALCIVYLRQKKYNTRNYGLKNGRGDLFEQLGKLQDDLHRQTQELHSDVAELRGMLRVHLKESIGKH